MKRLHIPIARLGNPLGSSNQNVTLPTAPLGHPYFPKTPVDLDLIQFKFHLFIAHLNQRLFDFTLTF